MEWISVEDELPEDETHVLVWTDVYCGDVAGGMSDLPNISVCEYNSRYGNGFEVSHTDYYMVVPVDVTHWMPLPKPPKGG